MKTLMPKKEEIKRNWYLLDAKNKTLGRLATQIALLLMGKHRPDFSYHQDVGDWVVVINCEKVKVTGKKREEKVYYRYSGYPGGLKALSFRQLQEKDPRRIIFLAVRGMLPKNKLRKKRLARLKIFVGENHPYTDRELLEVKEKEE